MSTFGGWMPEFPDIRGTISSPVAASSLTHPVDQFRTIEGVRPPLACFLSHVHSDHLSGLESLKAPFIYCSAATKEVLIRLERYPHRINFQLRILESRRQHYKHLRKLLRPIPLETPTTLELAPGNEIQVTLFDANHCIGAVMFLIEGGGKAVLYTGDIRSEPWFVNNLRRNPSLIQYTSGQKTLDCIYLDTSFTDDITFPTKAEGIKELLEKVVTYPTDTIFHFTAWTYGYEDVWLALARALKSKIHVDEYRMRIYQSLRKYNGVIGIHDSHLALEGPTLAGFQVGNHNHEGILTLDQEVRLHSCEKGTGCKCDAVGNNTVWIKPIITRIGNREVAEIGIGGGGVDLTQNPELQLDDEATIRQLIVFFSDPASTILPEMREKLKTALHSTGKILSLDHLLSSNDLLVMMNRVMTETQEGEKATQQLHSLPKAITFPYSRHSSYHELLHLVSAFKPIGVFPCTVDEEWYEAGVSMKSLFGDHCSGKPCRYDVEMGNKHQKDEVASQDFQLVSLTNQSQEDLDIEESFPIMHSDNKIEGGIPADDHSHVGNSANGAVATDSKVYTMCRTSHEKLRLFDDDGNPVSVSGGKQAMDLTAYDMRASSPVFELQGVRRKAPVDDSHVSNKRSKMQEESSTSNNDLSEEENPAPTPHIEEDGDDDAVEDVSYWDQNEKVFRCVACHWEMWRPTGMCTGCGEGDIPYFEVNDPETKRVLKGTDDRVPSIVPDEYCDENEVDSPYRAELAGNYLDGISSYSSTDDELNDYEMNSFIDDESVRNAAGSGDDSLSGDNEEDDIDYQALHLAKCAEHSELLDSYVNLIDEHEDLRRDILGSKYVDAFAGSDMDSSSGFIVPLVDVQVQDPPLSELVVSFQGDSQASSLSAGRSTARQDAFNAALDVNGTGWHDLSLMSAGDNHTKEEVEL